jgi:hypothetical protein
MLVEYSSGPLIALEVSGPDAVRRMRELAGPRDAEVARRIRYAACVRLVVGASCRDWSGVVAAVVLEPSGPVPRRDAWPF